MLRARSDLSRWLHCLLCVALWLSVEALPTRIGPDGQAAEPVAFIQERARVGSAAAHQTAAAHAATDATEKLDFSLLNSLVEDHPPHAHRRESESGRAGSDDWAAFASSGQTLHGHFASPSDADSRTAADASLAELRATASARAGVSVGTVGGVPVAHLDRMNQRAVDQTLHLMGLDTPIEDEPVLEGLNPMRVLDQEIPSSAALLQLKQTAALRRNQRKLERAHGADGSMRPVRNAFSGSTHSATVGSGAETGTASTASQKAEVGQDDQVNFLQFHNTADIDAKVHRKRRREQQQQQKQDADQAKQNEPFDARAAGAAFALQEQEATAWRNFDHPNSDFKINERGSPTPQPSHKDLHEFLRRSLPAETMGKNFRFRQEPPAGGAAPPAGGGDPAAANQPGFAYKPSPFKHPPPPPVPPPPPPPPPPNFGPGSEFTGYRFGSTQAGSAGSPGSTSTASPPAQQAPAADAAPTTNFASFWEKAYPASSQFSPEGAKEWQMQSAQAAAEHEAHVDAGHDAFNPSFVEVDSRISGERASTSGAGASATHSGSQSEDDVHAAYAQWYHLYNLAHAYPGPAVPTAEPRFQQQQAQQQAQPQGQATNPAASSTPHDAFPSLEDYDATVNNVLRAAGTSS